MKGKIMLALAFVVAALVAVSAAQAHASTASITTDQPTYSVGQVATLSYSGVEGPVTIQVDCSPTEPGGTYTITDITVGNGGSSVTYTTTMASTCSATLYKGALVNGKDVAETEFTVS